MRRERRTSKAPRCPAIAAVVMLFLASHVPALAQVPFPAHLDFKAPGLLIG